MTGMIVMAFFNLSVKGAKELMSRFKRSKKKLSDTKGANLAAAVTIQKWVIKNIEAAGNNHKESRLKWPPLSPVTIALRRKGPRGDVSPKPLQDTGRLKGGFEVSATDKAGFVKNRVNYASIHENGKGRVPQRKMFPTVKQGEEIAKPAYEAFVRKAVK